MSSEVPDIELNKEICRELIDNALLGLGIIQNKKLVYANRSLADITGHTLEDMLALSANDFMSMIYPDDQHSILGAMIDGISSNKLPLRQEFRIIKKNGDIAWLDARANFIEYQGKTAMQVALLDITNLKNAEREANAAKKEYKEILHSISDGFFVLDEDLKITYFNKAAELLLGRTGPEVVGYNIFDAFPEARGSIFEDTYNWANKEKRSISFETYFGVKPYENWYDVRVYPRENGISVYFQVIADRKKAEEQLRQSEEQYRLLFETMVQGVVYQDANGNIISANPAAQRILGLTSDQIEGKTSNDPGWEAIHEDGSDFPGETHPAMIALATGKTVENVVMGIFNSNDMEYRWININAIPQFLPGEIKPYRVYSTFEDITGGKKAEDQLRTTLQRSYAILSSLNAGILLVTDEDRIEYANQAFCSLFNLEDRPQELVGLGSQEIIGKIRDSYLHPDEEVARIEEIVNQGQPVKGQEVSLQGGKTCLRDFIPISIDGKSYGRLWHHMEITKLKQIDEALQESEQRFRSIVENSEDGISLIDYSGKIVEWNDSQEYITGLKREEVLGKFAWDVEFQLIPDDQKTEEDYEKIKSFLIRLTDKGRIALKGWFEDQEIQLADGTRRTIHEVLFPIKTENGFSIGVVTRDITERAEKEKSLRIKDEAIESSLNAISLANSSGDLFYANESWLRKMGYEREEIVGRSLQDFLRYPNDADKIAEQISATGRWEGELVFRKKDGSCMDVHLSVSTVKDGSDRSVCIISSFVDISESKKAQKELMESENKLKAIFDLIPIGIYVVDKECRIIEANQSFIDFTDLSLDELNRKKNWEWKCFSTDESILSNPKNTEDNLYKNFPAGKAMHEKKPTPYIEIGIEKENGEIVWARTKAVPTPISDWGALCVVIDITEQRKMEESLRIKDAAIEAAITATVIADTKGILTYVNAAALDLWGYKKDEVLGKPARVFFGDPGEIDEVIDASLKKGAWSGDIVGKKKDGSTFDIHLSANIVKDAAGKPLCLIGSSLDITDRKKMEKDLREREERFRKIFELSPIGIQLYDSEGFIVNSNQVSQKIMNLIGTGKHKRYNIFREVIADIESKHKLEDGQIVSEGRWIKMKSAKAKDADMDKKMPPSRAGHIYIENIIASLGEAREPEGYLCLQQDLTEHKLADEAMISDNERLQIIYNIWKTRVKTSNMRIKEW
jgi:PAS domain S-box-containing protein